MDLKRIVVPSPSCKNYKGFGWDILWYPTWGHFSSFQANEKVTVLLGPYNPFRLHLWAKTLLMTVSDKAHTPNLELLSSFSHKNCTNKSSHPYLNCFQVRCIGQQWYWDQSGPVHFVKDTSTHSTNNSFRILYFFFSLEGELYQQPFYHLTWGFTFKNLAFIFLLIKGLQSHSEFHPLQRHCTKLY